MDRRQRALVVLTAYVIIHLPVSFVTVASFVLVGPVVGEVDWLAIGAAVATLVLSLGMVGLWFGVRSGADWLADQGRRFSRAFLVLHVTILLLLVQDNLDADLYLALLLALAGLFIGTDLWLGRALQDNLEASGEATA